MRRRATGEWAAALGVVMAVAGLAAHAAQGAGAAAQAAQAAPAATVKVGKETKKALGRVSELVAGDVACYITLKDDKGVEFQEMAEFEICEQTTLVGKRVSLTYALEKVLADECQGDPDCTKTKTVALVKKATVVAAAPAPAGKR